MTENRKRDILYSCPFIPAEWIAAHGFRPRRILPEAPAVQAGSVQGVCAYARAFLHAGQRRKGAAALLFTTTCDQMRRVSEVADEPGAPPAWLFHVPATWETPTAQKIYAAELRRLGRHLVSLGGRAPDDDALRRTMVDFDERRSRLRDARGTLGPKAFSIALARFHETGEVSLPEAAASPAAPGSLSTTAGSFPVTAGSAPAAAGRGIPVALVGGPMQEGQLDLFDLVEAAGGTIVLDATTSGERSLPAPFDRRALKEDPFFELVRATFGSIPDAFRRPNTLLYDWLRDRFAERGVRGVLFRQYTWCDTWRGEAERMKEWCRLPLIALDIGDDPKTLERTLSRIDAFMEVLQ